MGETQEPRRFKLTEDWLATLIGLAIVLIIALGLLGPGAQTVTVEVAPGETVSQEVPALTGWQVPASTGAERLTIAASAPIAMTVSFVLRMGHSPRTSFEGRKI